jgi:hypothetical protein
MSWNKLDWETSAADIDLGKHKRLLFCMLMGMLVTFAFLRSQFSHMHPFPVFWCSSVIGGVLGCLVGWEWQVADATRRATTSGKFIRMILCVWGLFALESVFVSILGFAETEKHRTFLRTLDKQPPEAFEFQFECGCLRKSEPVFVFDSVAIQEFVEIGHQSEVQVNVDRRAAELEFDFSIHFSNGSFGRYHAEVPEREDSRMMISFSTQAGFQTIEIPGGYPWLQKHVLQHPDLVNCLDHSAD